MREDRWSLLLSASPILALSLLTLSGAYLDAHLGAYGSVLVANLLITGASIGAKPALRKPELHPSMLLVLLGAGLVGVYALFSMSVSQVVEDSFFIHTSNMGLMERGYVPPVNPLGQPLQGHYGKDLLTSLLATLTHTQFLTTEWQSTVILQMLTFGLLYAWLTAENGRLQGLMGTGFAFFASHFGSRVGLLNCLTNNLAVTFAGLILTGYLCQRALRLGRSAWILAGLVLGLESLIYETYFGLAVLALLCVGRRRCLLVILGVAGMVAFTEGGALTHLHSRATSQAQTMQSQQLQLHVPKADLFQLRRDNLRPSRPFQTHVRPYEADFRASSASAYLWSRSILSCFWYPVWLCPLTAIWLLRRPNSSANWIAGWFFCLGLFAALTPAVVDFGYFNNESARWLIVTALGFTISFVLMLASAPRKIASVLLATLIYLSWPGTSLALGEMVQAVRNPGTTLADGSPGLVPGGTLIPNPGRELQHHYGFTPAQWRAADWLRRHSRRGQHFLCNFRDEAPSHPGVQLLAGGQLNVRGLLVGLTELFPAGLLGAPTTPLAPPMFSQSAQARAYWADLDPARLGPLGADYLLTFGLDSSQLERLKQTETLLYDREDCQVFKVRPTAPVPGTVSTLAMEPTQLETRQVGMVQMQATGSGMVEIGYGDEPVDVQVAFLHGSGTVPLVGAYAPGSYQLNWRNPGEPNWRPLGHAEVVFVGARRPPIERH